MENSIDDLIKFQSLQGNTINSLTHILDNTEILTPGALKDALISVINQLEINDAYFNQILDRI